MPKNIQPLLSDPGTMKYIEKIVSENPDKINELITKFVKTPKGKTDDLVLSKVCKIGKDQGKYCTSCYIGWGLIYDGKTFKLISAIFAVDEA